MKKINSRKILLILIDILSLVLACFAAYFLSNSLTIVHLEPRHVYWPIINFTICNMLALALSGAYRSIWRYANARDFVLCIFSLLLGSCASYLITVLTVDKDVRSNIYMVLSFPAEQQPGDRPADDVSVSVCGDQPPLEQAGAGPHHDHRRGGGLQDDPG